MDKISKSAVALYLSIAIFFCFTLTSCSNYQRIIIENHTQSILDIKILFENKYGKDVLDFTLKPRDYDGWEYETSYFDRSMLDESLKTITVSEGKKCRRVYTIDNIKKMVTKSWEKVIIINDDLLNCE